MGADCVITDAPDVILQALGGRPRPIDRDRLKGLRPGIVLMDCNQNEIKQTQ